MKEVYEGRKDYYHSVAVIKKNTLLEVDRLHKLRGAKACFPKVGSLAGWTMPVHRLIEDRAMDVVDCNNHVRSAIAFFGKSCAVNSLQVRATAKYFLCLKIKGWT